MDWVQARHQELPVPVLEVSSVRQVEGAGGEGRRDRDVVGDDWLLAVKDVVL